MEVAFYSFSLMLMKKTQPFMMKFVAMLTAMLPTCYVVNVKLIRNFFFNLLFVTAGKQMIRTPRFYYCC